MTQRFLMVAGMLRRYLSLLRPMREVYEAEGCMPVHQLTGFDVKTSPLNRVACVIRLILLALCVCLFMLRTMLTNMQMFASAFLSNFCSRHCPRSYLCGGLGADGE